MLNCTSHNLVPARLRCVNCGHLLCDLCVRTLDVQGQRVSICGHCGGMTAEIDGLSRAAGAPCEASFWKEVAGILIYPVRGFGIATIIMGTVFFIIMDFIRAFPLFSLLMGIVITGYLLKYYVTVVQQSAKGVKSPPTWAEIELLDFGDLFRTYFRTIGVFIFTFALPILYVWQIGPPDTVFLVLLGVSIFYFPMAFLVVAYYESIEALNPIPAVKSIGRAFIHYIVVVLLFYVIIVLDWALAVALGLSNFWSRSLADIAALTVAHRFVSLYLFTSLMHLLGVFLYCNKQRLNWQ